MVTALCGRCGEARGGPGAWPISRACSAWRWRRPGWCHCPGSAWTFFAYLRQGSRGVREVTLPGRGRLRSEAPARPAAARTGGGGTRRRKVRPGSAQPPGPRSSGSVPVHVVPYPANFCLCLGSFCGSLSLPLLSVWFHGGAFSQTALPLRRGHNVRAYFPSPVLLPVASFNPCPLPSSPVGLKIFPFVALTPQKTCPKTAPLEGG